MDTIATDASGVPAADASGIRPLTNRAQRRRANRGKVRTPARMPNERHVSLGVRVELTGRHGQKRETLLDVEKWAWIKPVCPWWGRVRSTQGDGASWFVSSGTRAAAELAASAGLAPQASETAPKTAGSHPQTCLARLLARPGPGEVVRHINGDPLDLRMANLEVISVAEQREREKNGRRFLPFAEAILAEIGE